MLKYFFLQKTLLLIFSYVCMCIYMWKGVHTSVDSSGSREVIRYTGAQVRGGCELPNMGIGNPTTAFLKSTVTLLPIHLSSHRVDEFQMKCKKKREQCFCL